jgi:hypothetical protein
MPATAVTTAAALVFATLAAFVAALAHSEPPVVVRGAPAADRVMRYLGTYRAGETDAQKAENDAVAAAGERFLDGVAGRTYRIDASNALDVTGAGAAAFVAPAVAIASSDIGAHATLLAGRWPGAERGAAGVGSAGRDQGQSFGQGQDQGPSQNQGQAHTTPTPIEVAVPESLVGSQNLHPGSALKLDTPGRLSDPAAGRPVIVVGVYRPDSSAFWQALPPASLPAVAADPAQALVVDPSVLADPHGIGQVGSTTWIVDPGLGTLSASEISALVDRANSAIVTQDARALPGAAPISPAIIVSTALPEQRAVARRATVVGEAELAVPAGVLILLATTAMVRAARTVASRRRGDLVLARGRGAGTGWLLGAAALEGIGIGVVLLAVVPFLAPVLARLLGSATSVKALSFPATASQSAVIVAVVAVLQAVLAVSTAWPDAVERAPGAALRRRSTRVARFQRAGTDLVLAGLAVWGFLQLDHYRSPLVTKITAQTAATDGGGSLDPVLILVPALVTGALAILALRLLPLLVRPLDRQARRRRGLTGAFGAWQISRRTPRLTGALLLMVMAISVGALALTATTMRARNAGDQAAFGVGADARVDTSGLPPATRRAAYLATPGVAAATPFWTLGVTTADTSSTATTLIGVDPRSASRVLAFGPGTATPSATTAIAHLGGAPLGGLSLPGRPAKITVQTTATVSDGELPPGSELQLTVTDASGLSSTHIAPLTLHDVTFELSDANALSYPLRITRIEAATSESPTVHLVHLVVRDIIGTDAAGAVTGPATAQAGGGWQILDNSPASLLGNSPETRPCPNPVPQPPPGESSHGVMCQESQRQAEKAEPGTLFTLDFLTPAVNPAPGTDPPHNGPYALTAALPATSGDSLPPAVPAVVNQDLLTATRTKVGDTITVTADDSPAAGAGPGLQELPQMVLHITGVVAAVPGRPAGPAALVDLPTLADQLPSLHLDRPGDTPWLLKTAPGSESEVGDAFAAQPALGTPILSSAATHTVRDDVFRAGSAGLFTACVVLAPLFALLGFAMDTVTSIRERSRGFAALRAFGARPRELASALLIEQGVVAGLALLAGTVIGAGVAAVTEPLLATSSDGSAAQPPMAVLIPWLRAGGLGVVTVAAVVAALFGIARAAAGLDLARVLRAGEDL